MATQSFGFLGMQTQVDIVIAISSKVLNQMYNENSRLNQALRKWSRHSPVLCL